DHVGTISDAVGHDLRTPLSSATAAVSSLRSTDVKLSKKDRDELLETAEISLRRLADLVSDLLDASRLQAGVLPIALTAVGLDEVVPLALDELGLRDGNIVVDVPADLPAALCDPVLLQRVLVNLLSNALRYSPTESAPLISASAFASRLELRIIDRGPGIPAAKLTEALQPFQRLGDADNTTGVGLGLALSNGFMTAMGGSLEAEDTPGGGLTMVVRLPMATESVTS
ncbi:MAG: ATP-binding protein, partial [Actinomycetota bacterium]